MTLIFACFTHLRLLVWLLTPLFPAVCAHRGHRGSRLWDHPGPQGLRVEASERRGHMGGRGRTWVSKRRRDWGHRGGGVRMVDGYHREECGLFARDAIDRQYAAAA